MKSYYLIACLFGLCFEMSIAVVKSEYFCQENTKSLSKKDVPTTKCALNEKYESSFTETSNQEYDLRHNYYLYSELLEAQLLGFALNGWYIC